jgi:hypothetical protein
MKIKSNVTPSKSNPLPSPEIPVPPLRSPAPPAVERAPSHEEIAASARLLWLKKGCPEGRDDEIWFEAGRQLASGRAQPATPLFPKTSAGEDTRNAYKIEDMLDDIGEPGGNRSATSL